MPCHIRSLSVFLLCIVCCLPGIASALESSPADTDEPTQVTLPFIVEVGKPIKLDHTLTVMEGSVVVLMRELAEYTPVQIGEDRIRFRYTSIDAQLLDVKLGPAMAEELVSQSSPVRPCTSMTP